jgi:pyruvate carboxylase subunit B
MADPTFRAHVGDRTYDFDVEDGTLRIDGTPVDYSFEQVGSHYFSLVVDGQSTPLVVERDDGDTVRLRIDGRTTTVRVQDEQDLLLERFGLDAGPGAGEREVRAPMPGLVLDLMVEVGDAVAPDEGLLVLEAMKMENELKAPVAGRIEAVHVTAGDAVDKDALLIEIDAED